MCSVRMTIEGNLESKESLINAIKAVLMMAKVRNLPDDLLAEFILVIVQAAINKKTSP